MQTVEVKQILKPRFTRSNLPEEILEELTIPYTPGFDMGKNKINTGLTLEEEAYFLPMIIPFPSTDPNFRKEIEKFYINFSERIPKVGLAIDASYDVDDKGRIIPKNVRQFLMSKMLSNDTTVLSNIDNKNVDDYLAKFELIDITKQKEIDNDKFKNSLKAQEEYLKIVKNANNVGTVKEILVLIQEEVGKSVIEIHMLSHLEASKILGEYVEKNGERFLKIINTPNLKLIALATEAINMNAISRLGDSYYLEGTKNLAPTKKGVADLMATDNEIRLKIEALVKQYKEDYSRY